MIYTEKSLLIYVIFFIDENKPQLDHIQSDFVSPQVQVLGVNNHHKGNHRLNGVLPRMNITPNPLAQEADKVSVGINHYRYSKHFALWKIKGKVY